jgi:hypothetical protein
VVDAHLDVVAVSSDDPYWLKAAKGDHRRHLIARRVSGRSGVPLHVGVCSLPTVRRRERRWISRERAQAKRFDERAIAGFDATNHRLRRVTRKV